MPEEESVKIVFPEPPRESSAYDVFMRLAERKNMFDVEEILGWFKKLKVSQIELWLETVVKTGTVVQLFASIEGKGGVKVTLVPKPET